MQPDLFDLIRFVCEQLALDVYGVAWQLAHEVLR